MRLNKSLSIALFALTAASLAVFPVVGARAVNGSGPNLTVEYRGGVTGPAKSFDANIGDTVQFEIEIHNTNVPSTAGDLTVKVNLPSSPTGSTIGSTVNVSTTTQTTVPGSQTNVSDSVNLTNLPGDALLQYEADSLRVTADLNGDGAKEYNNQAFDNITTNGINLGTLHGGDPAVIQMSFRAKVLAAIAPNLTVKFQSGNNSRHSQGWSDDTSASPGDVLQYYIEIHNPNAPSVAKDVRVKVDFPDGQEGTRFGATARVSAVNATTVSDPTEVNFDAKAKVAYRRGSLRIFWDKDGDGTKEYDGYVWPNDDLFGGGIVLGDLWGCNQFIVQLTFFAESAKVETAAVSAQISIDKKVRWNNSDYDNIDRAVHLFDPGEKYEYKLIVKNTGTKDATDVKVVDNLPAYIRTLDGAQSKEFNVGTLAAGKEWSATYEVKVLGDLPQNDRTQVNRATVTTGNAGSDEDEASVWINGPEIIAAAAAAAKAEKLPETGAEGLVGLGLTSLLSIGLYLRRRLAQIS